MKLAGPSHTSAVRGYPWLNTTGWPLPQSLKKIVVPSVVVTVGMLHSYLAMVGCWRGSLRPRTTLPSRDLEGSPDAGSVFDSG
jgi:hypothetical protein